MSATISPSTAPLAGTHPISAGCPATGDGAGFPPMTRPVSDLDDDDDFDFGRLYFNGCGLDTASTFTGLTKFVPLVGPLSPRPHRSLVDVVASLNS